MNTLISPFQKQLLLFCFLKKACVLQSPQCHPSQGKLREHGWIFTDSRSGPTLQEKMNPIFFFLIHFSSASFLWKMCICSLACQFYKEYEQDNLRQSQNIRPSLPRDRYLPTVIKKLLSPNLAPKLPAVTKPFQFTWDVPTRFFTSIMAWCSKRSQDLPMFSPLGECNIYYFSPCNQTRDQKGCERKVRINLFQYITKVILWRIHYYIWRKT